MDELSREERKELETFTALAKMLEPDSRDEYAREDTLLKILEKRPLEENFTTTIDNKEYRWPSCNINSSNGNCARTCCTNKPFCYRNYLLEDVSKVTTIHMRSLLVEIRYPSRDLLNLIRVLTSRPE
jgi:hypothetical protein